MSRIPLSFENFLRLNEWILLRMIHPCMHFIFFSHFFFVTCELNHPVTASDFSLLVYAALLQSVSSLKPHQRNLAFRSASMFGISTSNETNEKREPNPRLAFFPDNSLHTDVHHNTEQKICHNFYFIMTLRDLTQNTWKSFGNEKKKIMFLKCSIKWNCMMCLIACIYCFFLGVYDEIWNQ